MKKSDKNRFAASDSLLDEAIEIDSAAKLRCAVQKERSMAFRVYAKRVSLLAACLCLCFCSVLIYRVTVGEPNTVVKVVSPITSVESVSEMKKYLGFEVPTLADKNISECILYAEGDYANMGMLVYEDGAKFRIQKGTGDISGVHGGKLLYTIEQSGVTVHYYSWADEQYAVWTAGGFACCYFASDNETNYSSNITEIISALQK